MTVAPTMHGVLWNFYLEIRSNYVCTILRIHELFAFIRIATSVEVQMIVNSKET